MNEEIRKIWDERPQDLYEEVYGALGNPMDEDVEAWGRRLALATLQAAPQPDSTDHGGLDYRDKLQHFIETLGTPAADMCFDKNCPRAHDLSDAAPIRDLFTGAIGYGHTDRCTCGANPGDGGGTTTEKGCRFHTDPDVEPEDEEE